ncbi:MAG TPA: CoA ester lyase [Streptosporangiaceae bacterium]|jgi:citrate lyase subunit beta/citryl-CoA lyase
MADRYRPRRSCLSVPASSERFIAKARDLPVDEVFLDLEDAVAPAAKDDARRNAVAALTSGSWRAGIRAVRVNDATTPWAYQDVVALVEGAGAALDVIILPKVTDPGHLVWLDLLLTQAERATGRDGDPIGIDAQIEDAQGLAAVEAIAAASGRLESLVFGPADFMASIGMPSLTVGQADSGYAGDAFYYPLMRILIAARAHGLQAIDGPYVKVRDVDGFRRAAGSVAALGFDGKWVLHPDQVAAANETFTPGQADYDRAELVLDAYDHATTVDQRGAVMLNDEMIDEAMRKMALRVALKGRAAGLERQESFTPPAGS